MINGNIGEKEIGWIMERIENKKKMGKKVGNWRNGWKKWFLERGEISLKFKIYIGIPQKENKQILSKKDA